MTLLSFHQAKQNKSLGLGLVLALQASMSTASLSVVVLTLSACVAPGAMRDEPPVGEMPTGTPTPAPEAPIASEYQLQSTLALTLGSLTPTPGYDLLQDLDSDPGSAIVTIAETAGIPAADILFDALPSTLSGKVTGWMSDALGSSSELQTLRVWSQLVVSEVELHSTLTLQALDADDHAEASHVLDTLVFRLDGKEIAQAIPAIAALPGAGHAELDLWVDTDDEGRYLVLGEHRFGLLLGEAAYLAFEEAIVERYGKDLRGLLGAALNCEAMADEVADKCVLSVCVGHASELEAICEFALDEAVEGIHEQFSALDTELLRFGSGSAVLLSDQAQSTARLVEGEWDASADFGLGLRKLSANFTGAAAR